MKILFVANRYEPAIGGAEIVQKRLAEGLALRGHAVTILATDFLNSHGSERVPQSHETINNVRVIRFRGLRFRKDPFTFSLEMFTWLKSHGNEYDVIVCFTYGYPTTWVPAVMKIIRVLKAPLVVQPHYGPVESIPKLVVRIFDASLGRITISASDEIVLLTPLFREFFIQHGGRYERISIIPPVVLPVPTGDETRIDELKTKFNIPAGKIYLLSLSRLVEYKGVQLLIDGIRSLADTNPEVLDVLHVIIAGDGDYREKLVQQVVEKKLSGVVTFTGRVDDNEKDTLFRFSDVFALLSYSGESFGVTIVEAMSAGIPVIGSDRGAIPWVVEDGKTGKIVDPFDARQVDEAIRFFLDGNNRREYGAHAIESAQQYNEGPVLDRFEEMLASLPAVHDEEKRNAEEEGKVYQSDEPADVDE